MGFRFRKSIKLMPGVKLNISKSGLGVSAGVRGARVSVGPRGTHTSVGIPGTGLSYTQKIGSNKRAANTNNTAPELTPEEIAAIEAAEKAEQEKRRAEYEAAKAVLVEEYNNAAISKMTHKDVLKICGWFVLAIVAIIVVGVPTDSFWAGLAAGVVIAVYGFWRQMKNIKKRG